MFIFSSFGPIGMPVSNHEITGRPIANLLGKYVHFGILRVKSEKSDPPFSRAPKKGLIYPLVTKIPGWEESIPSLFPVT